MASAEWAIQYAVEKLGQLVIDEIKFLYKVRDDVYWMQTELRWMSGFLEDADAKWKNGDERTKTWIRELTKVAYEAEDVVDAFMLHTSIPSKLVGLHYVGTEILLIKSKIRDISERKDRYGISNLGESSGSKEENLRAQRNINPHLSGNKYFVGFGSHKKLILERLIDPQVKKYVVVPIVGMGGLGKTTLATMIYNSDVAKDWFPYLAWVTVSEEFKPLELLHDLIKQVEEGDSEKYNNMNTIELKVQVRDCLKKQRYLIVFDDIWEQDPDVWNQLKDIFPDVENGSRVLITTRFISVAKSVDPSNEPNVLPFLNDIESWQLFLNIVFPSEDGSEPKCPEALESLGKELVKKCGGLPLGVNMLGGLLSVKEPTKNAWNKVAAKWKYQNKSLKYLQILALSYDNLPNVNMKSCFLYMGNYPEDHVIRASELTKFWIAEGFIPNEENQTFEETANDYLDEFFLRCMVQVVDRTKTSKRVKHFRIHDLFRKWCISEAQEDGFFRICTSNTDTSSPETVDARRLTVYKSTSEDKFHDLSYKARAILGFDYLSAGNFLLSNIGRNFKLLRLIYLNFPENVKIHKSKSLKKISRLIHLRNITLISKALTYLPSSIGKLHNLQTLNIKNTNILKLPTTLYQIHSLRHLYTRGITIKSSANWNLRNLQTLDSIKAGTWMLKDFMTLLNLRKLSIFGITKDGVRMLHDSIYKLHHLKSLCLESDNQPATSLFTSFRNHNPLSKLALINWSNVSSEFPQNLISIKLSGCTFEKGVIASLEKLQGLANLNLEDCDVHPEDEFVYSGNGFQLLENLHIGEMRSLLDWRIVNGALPKIKYLIIKGSNWLAKLPDGLEHLKSLQKLEMMEFKENLKRRLLETLEDQHKIPQITYVTLNGIQLDQYKRSSDIRAAPARQPRRNGNEVERRAAQMLDCVRFEKVFHPTRIGMGAYHEESTLDDEPVLSTKDDEPILSTSDDEPILSLEDESVRGRSKFKMPKARVMVNRKMEEPLGESKCKVMLDVVGHKHHVGRPGVDIVIVLGACWGNLEIEKLAMKFVLEKLSSDDRVSIIISSRITEKLCPLRHIKKRSLADIEIMIDSLPSHCNSNTAGGIVMALQVLSDRRFTTGRMAAVLLMSDGNLSTLDYNIPQIKLFNIPIYTFGFGKYCDERMLRDISNLSVGGTFSYIWNTDDFSIAFSQCFVGLLGVAIPDLKLTVRKINSTIQTVSAGNYTQSMDNAAGSVTINFGNIYVNQLCKIIVDLSLPAVERPRTEDILEITLRAADGLTRLPIYVDVTRCRHLS